MKNLEVFLTALKLGCSSFGGPIAHLGFFRDEYVAKKKWISEAAYADLVALCQFLPGPASSQVGMAIGLSRAGVFGAILAWLGFTLPSALLLTLVGLGITHKTTLLHGTWIHGLKVVAVAVVAQAIVGMRRKLCPDWQRMALATISALFLSYAPTVMAQLMALVVAGVLGIFFLPSSSELPHEPFHQGRKSVGAVYLAAFLALLLGLPILRELYPTHSLELFDSFYRAGSLVFGGGHVVLPLLQAEVVPSGWVTSDQFMTGYGFANAIPGPLFAFSAYLGSLSAQPPQGWVGALLCLIAAFLPSFLLIVGILPFWEKLRSYPHLRQAMLGLNAAVVGMLLAAFIHPVWTSAIFGMKDFVLAAVGFCALEYGKLPSWLVVLISMALSHFL